MEILLTFEETRIIGSLIEKELTTPEYYPLTVNSLKNACNQKSNRNPVVNFDESLIEKTVEDLQVKTLAAFVGSRESRVAKYKHNFSSYYKLSLPETAVMCVLMLRGAQTPGEIRGRTGRMYEFQSLTEAEEVLNNLMLREMPLVMKLPKLPGTKEARYVHLLSGEPDVERYAESSETNIPDNDKLNLFETEITNLRNELLSLRKEFEEFKSQF